MANVENLTQKILDDAKREASEILAQAKEKALQITDRKGKETEEEVQRITRSAENEAERSRERVLSNARLKVRNEELSIKQEKMEEAFTRAKALLSEMPDAEFKAFLENTLKNLGTGTNQVVQIPAKRKAAVGTQIAGRPVEVTDAVTDGFSVKEGQLYFNYYFDALVDASRDEMEQEVRDSLFAKEG